MFENPINKLRFWCHKVIPLVYDEALSYYEAVCKVAKKINEVITDVNSLHETVVFQVNGKEPTDGNVQLGAEDFVGAFVGSINGITPEEDGSITIDAEDVGAIPSTTRVVKEINGISPNEDGTILAGTVRSVNGKSPTSLPTPGSITLNASDVGALPDSVDPVESVNGISPDAQGNVNVGTVKSVNNTMPDASGNVNLPTVAGVTSVDGVGADAQGNVQINAVKSVNGETPDAQGAVNINAQDVGALPDDYTPPVVSVNNKTGAVVLGASDVGAMANDVPVIKTVNNIGPNASGGITISDSETPVFKIYDDIATWNSDYINLNVPHVLRLMTWGNIIVVNLEFRTLQSVPAYTEIVTGGMPLSSINLVKPVYTTSPPVSTYLVEQRTDGKIRAFKELPADTTLLCSFTYMKSGASQNNIAITNS